MKLLKAAFALAVALAVLSLDDTALTRGELALTEAHAVRGRPATPLSYAGVARRTTRRAVAVGTAAAVAAPRCVQTVDVYGRVITRCY